MLCSRKGSPVNFEDPLSNSGVFIHSFLPDGPAGRLVRRARGQPLTQKQQVAEVKMQKLKESGLAGARP